MAQVSDEIVWDVINQQFCSFKIKLPHKSQTFCRNEYNHTGLCNRQSCPLANTRYATIRSDPADAAQLYLYTKTAERAHLPSRLWERTKLDANYAHAMEQVDAKLAYWPKYMIHRCKQRLTRLTQVALRTRRLAKEDERLGERIVPRMAPKVRRREEVRERKAERAAKVERVIERELLERLRSGVYGDKPLNVDEKIWEKVLNGLEREVEGEEELEDEEEEGEYEDEEYEREMEEDDGEGDVEYVSDIGEDSDEDDLEEAGAYLDDDDSEDENSDEDNSEESEEDDDEKLKKVLGNLKRKKPQQPPPVVKKRKPTKGPKREIEYEIEHEPVREALYA